MKWIPAGVEDMSEEGLIGKDPDSGKDWRQKEKGAAADEMVR